MSLEALANDVRDRLAHANTQLESALADLSPEKLANSLEFTARFQLTPNDPIHGELAKFTFSQLNSKGERVQANINHLKRLSTAYANIQECELILRNPEKSILDLKKLHSILANIQRPQVSDRNYSLTIYDNIQKWSVTMRESLLMALNNSLKSAVPTPYLISNIEQFHEICVLAQEWGFSLEYMRELRAEWDSIVTQIISDSEPPISLVFDDTNLIDDSVAIELGNDLAVSTIKSVTGFIEFINHARIELLKQFLSSKISNMLTTLISANINKIISDPAKMKELKHLIELCSLTDWNVLKQLRGGLMQTNLNAMHIEWQIGTYISRARLIIMKGSIGIQTPWTPQPPAPSDTKESEVADWDNGWDDDWDVQIDEEDNKVENEVSSPDSSSDAILVSDVARELFGLLLDYQQNVSSDTVKLSNSIKALLSAAYSNFPNPLSLYNDLLYLDQTTKTPNFGKFAHSYWSQCLARYYTDLRAVILLLSLDCENEPENLLNDKQDYDDEFDSWGQDEDENAEDSHGFIELTNHNLTQLRILHLWFKKVFEESEMHRSNPRTFVESAVEMIEYVNTCFYEVVCGLGDITGDQLKIIPALVDGINNITVPYLNMLTKTRDEIKSYHRLESIKFLMRSSMKQIMDKFFEGDLYDVETKDLINIIKAIFVESDTRTGYLNEIIEFRESF